MNFPQMMEHFYCEAPEYEAPLVKPFTKIEEHNFSKYTQDSIYHFTETITPVSSITSKIFSGFKKSYHNLYKFDSKTEKDFAIILEQDKAVMKWLRPALNQFHIYWNHNSKRYCPDFIVETEKAIYMIETKKADSIDTIEVEEKSRAALEYCKYSTEFTDKNEGKPWEYILIPHNFVMLNMSFDGLIKKYRLNL
jgi:type III restriction enzyme